MEIDGEELTPEQQEALDAEWERQEVANARRYRIDNFSTALLSSYGANFHVAWGKAQASLIWDFAEKMEAERARRLAAETPST